MSDAVPGYATVDEWVAREAIGFSLDSPGVFEGAVDRMMEAVGASVEVLGFGEALHGSEEMLIVRNRLFRRLVAAHGFSAIAVESSFPRGRVVDEFVAGRGGDSYETVRETGFSHGFGRMGANRELVEWMRGYNADASRGGVRLTFYGFDSPTEMTGTDGPRQVVRFVLDYLASVDGGGGEARRERIEGLLGRDADWENPAAMMDPTKSVGLSAAAAALRLETEELISELRLRGPELAGRDEEGRYAEAVQHAVVARQLLNYHAGLARASANRTAELLGIRDLMMADNLAYASARERGRGRVLAFAHNSHLKRGRAEWRLAGQLLAWWPAGAHLNETLGTRYVVIGSGVGVSEGNGIGVAEAGTLEARLMGVGAAGRLIPTHRGKGLEASGIAGIATRSGSGRNSSYFPLTPQSVADFDWLAVLGSRVDSSRD